MRVFPGITDASGFSIWNGDGVYRICILMIEHEDILVAATRGDMKTTGLIRI